MVEKILLGDEKLPEGWRCAGTTGYDAMWRIGALFADPGGADLLRKGFAEGTGEHRGWAEVERESRRHVLGALLGAEVARLVELALDICAEDGRAAVAEPTQLGLTDALVEVLVHIPVYRLYVAAGTPASSELLQAWEQVVAASTADSPHRTAEISLIRDIAVGAFGRSELKDEFIRRLQQTCGAAVAKGVEDTAAYRWTPLSSMNEVGASPDSCGLPAAEFHAWAAVRAARWPDTMNALTTHDAKRGEDVRARITALSEAPQRWLDLAARWTHSGLPGDVDSSGALRRDPISASLLWQTLWGAWPISADRLDEYLRKAAREAKLHTSWLAPDQAYESALLELGHRALADPALRADFAALERDLVDAIAANTLGATAVHLLLPGVPDVYQGTEQLFLRLVDPDNRQEPDWAGLHRSLDRALSAPPDPSQGLDAAKLRLTALALRLRRDSPEVFGSPSDYAPLAAAGPTAQHLFGFVRGDVAVTVTRWASRLAEAGGWGATVADLAPGRWVDLLSARAHDVGPAGVALAGLHASWPVTLLVRER